MLYTFMLALAGRVHAWHTFRKAPPGLPTNRGRRDVLPRHVLPIVVVVDITIALDFFIPNDKQFGIILRQQDTLCIRNDIPILSVCGIPRLKDRVNSPHSGCLPNTGYRPLYTMMSHFAAFGCFTNWWAGPLCGLWPHNNWWAASRPLALLYNGGQ